MEKKYCWRCKKEAPFLNEEEFEEIYTLYSKCQNIMTGFREAQNSPISETPVDHFFKPVRDAYEKMTGYKETNHNAIMHHRLSSIGLDCPGCKKPLRTPQATSCPECNWKKEVRKAPHKTSGDVRPSTLLREGIQKRSLLEVEEQLWVSPGPARPQRPSCPPQLYG